jgi:hypothetical protein
VARAVLIAPAMRQLLLASTIAALFIAPTIATAQPSVTPAAPAPLATVPAPAADAPRELSPGIALGLSLGVTAAGYAAAFAADEADSDALPWIAVTGIAFGPTAGHWYQGDVVTRGLGIRALGTAAFIGGLSTVDWFCDHECDNGDDELGEVLMVGGLIAFAAGTVDDIVSAPLKAQRRNEENRRRSLQLTVAPRITSKDAGLVLAGSF